MKRKNKKEKFEQVLGFKREKVYKLQDMEEGDYGMIQFVEFDMYDYGKGAKVKAKGRIKKITRICKALLKCLEKKK